MTVKEIISEVIKDGMFYRRSGGVTIPGGEIPAKAVRQIQDPI